MYNINVIVNFLPFCLNCTDLNRTTGGIQEGSKAERNLPVPLRKIRSTPLHGWFEQGDQNKTGECRYDT